MLQVIKTFFDPVTLFVFTYCTPAGVSLEKLRAKFNFEATSDKHLSLKIGDIIVVVERHPSGWFKGTCNGVVGMFPSNYTEAVSQAAPEDDATRTKVAELKAKRMSRLQTKNSASPEVAASTIQRMVRSKSKILEGTLDTDTGKEYAVSRGEVSAAEIVFAKNKTSSTITKLDNDSKILGVAEFKGGKQPKAFAEVLVVSGAQSAGGISGAVEAKTRDAQGNGDQKLFFVSPLVLYLLIAHLQVSLLRSSERSLILKPLQISILA
jgi:hypothetical protein